MANEQTKVFALKLGGVLGMAVLFAAAPLSVRMENGVGLPYVALSAALAKSGNSGSGSSGSGHSGGSDDSGHHSGDDDDDDDDDNGHHSGGHHNGTTTGGTGGGGLSVAKIESSASGIEVTYSDGSREEIENGRYEAKNSAGWTIVERSATQADIDRLSALF
jgi:hypothetical protein